jgi:hypothetical protein
MSRLDIRNAALCFLICAAAFLLVDPIAQMPFQDDWSYAFSARQCAATGHLTYNGWSTAIILPHVYWGALWIRLFGFSFTVLRLSTLPLAAGSVALAYLLARQADLRPSAAFFVAMLLAFSPLFLPVATSYMVDVPGLFFMLASLCALVRAARSGGWLWIFVGAGLGMIGGMSRQIGWIVPLALLPYLALVRRREVGFLLCATAAWAIVVVNVVWSMRWFAHQPLALQDWTAVRSLDALHNPIRTFLRFVPLGLTLMLVILPAALAVMPGAMKELWRRRAGRGGAAAAIACALLAILLLRNPRFGLEPWMPITITTQGVMDGLELSGHRPVSQPLIVRGILSAAVLFAIAILASSAVTRARSSWTSVRDLWFPRAGRIAAPALLLFGLAYVALLVPRADQNWLTDRYAIPLIPVLGIFLLRRGSESPPTAAWALLFLYALYTLASTQDLLALERARGQAVRKLSDAGVAPTAIAAGFEYDCWAELLATGFINDYRIPPALFKPDVGLTPSLRPLYRLEFERQSDTIPSSFGAVEYFSALPPFHRRIFIDRFPRPWWTDPQQLRAAGRPPPMSYESYYDSD